MPIEGGGRLSGHSCFGYQCAAHEAPGEYAGKQPLAEQPNSSAHSKCTCMALGGAVAAAVFDNETGKKLVQ